MAQRSVQTYRDGALVDEQQVDVPDEQVNADALRDRADQAIAALEQSFANRGAGAPPAAIQWLTVRVVIALARIVLGRLETS